MKEKKKMRFELADIYLAAYLKCMGFFLKDLFKANPKAKRSRVIFVLIGESDNEDIVADYFNDRAVVNPKQFKTELQDLKSLIYTGILSSQNDNRYRKKKPFTVEEVVKVSSQPSEEKTKEEEKADGK